MEGIASLTVFDYLEDIRQKEGQAVFDDIVNAINLTGDFKATLTLAEQHIYGSSRLGVHHANLKLYEIAFNGTMNSNAFDYAVSINGGESLQPALNQTKTLHRGKRQYELANHLGNVLAVISDRKLGVDDPNEGTASGSAYYAYIDYYIADIASAQDYYPFGMQMPGRTYSNVAFNETYRYGFNGMEKDDEMSGDEQCADNACERFEGSQ